MNTTTHATYDLMPALLIFTRQFAALIRHGIKMTQVLATLEEDAPAPYGAAARRLLDATQRGYSLTAAMSDDTGVFPPTYRALIRAGEVGGILEELLAVLTELLDAQWRRQQAGLPFWDVTASRRVECWAALAAPQQLNALSLWCRTLGLLLGAGVPRPVALTTAAELLPPAECHALQQLAGTLPEGNLSEVLRPLGFLTATALALIEAGDRHGGLDLALEEAARLYHDWVGDAPWLATALVQPADSALDSLIPTHLRRRYRVTVLRREGTRLVVAMADPTDVTALDDLRLVTGYEIMPVPVDDAEDAPILRMINVILQHAITEHADRVAIARVGDEVRVRFHIDSKWHPTMTLPGFTEQPLFQRVRRMADIPPDAGLPQHGHILLRHERQDYDIIVDFLPAAYGTEMHLALRRAQDTGSRDPAD